MRIEVNYRGNTNISLWDYEDYDRAKSIEIILFDRSKLKSVYFFANCSNGYKKYV